MNVGIYFNRRYISENLPNIERIKSVLALKKVVCRIVESIEELDGLDVLFVLGGDGTILTVASECAVRGVKIIGVNYGHMGFLAEFEPDNLDEAIELVSSGAFETQKRSLLKVEYRGSELFALNDCVIQRETSGNNFLNTVSIRAEIDGDTVDNFSSDGIIVSTPTGSTAYSLAAGGSVLTPDINAFILTPICAHSLHSRPVVYGDDSVLTVSPVNAHAPLALIVDGRVAGNVSNGDRIRITKADYTLEFITKKDKNFFTKLLFKLSKWSK